MSNTDTAGAVEYNVYCANCGCVWQPGIGSPLWWQAKKHAEQGHFDAMCVQGEVHGCITKRVVRKPDAPFRVFGYSCMCEDFDIPFYSFIEAVKEFQRRMDTLDMVFISGVSETVIRKIKLKL